MKIGVYCNNYRPEDGGANSLVSTIISEIKNDNNSRHDFVFISSDKRNIPYKRNIDGFVFLNIDHKKLIGIDFKSKISRLFGIELCFSIDKLVRKEKIDLLLFISPFYAYVKSSYIFPVWDLGHRTTNYPEVTKWYVKHGRDFMYKKMLSRATYILTGNETGKKEIMHFYKVEASKIMIAPFPVSKFCFGESSRPSFDIPKVFFFYPAQFWQHKNHVTIINALSILSVEYSLKPVMFFTGADHGTKKMVKKQVASLGLDEQVRFTGFLKDEEIKYLYENATAMVFASMIGPNNLPPLEALYLGCPVIITDIEGHKEQMKDMAIYFNGNDPESLAKVMYKTATDKQYRDCYVCKDVEIKRKLREYKYVDGLKPLFDKAQLHGYFLQ